MDFDSLILNEYLEKLENGVRNLCKRDKVSFISTKVDSKLSNENAHILIDRIASIADTVSALNREWEF